MYIYPVALHNIPFILEKRNKRTQGDISRNTKENRIVVKFIAKTVKKNILHMMYKILDIMKFV